MFVLNSRERDKEISDLLINFPIVGNGWEQGTPSRSPAGLGDRDLTEPSPTAPRTHGGRDLFTGVESTLEPRDSDTRYIGIPSSHCARQPSLHEDQCIS